MYRPRLKELYYKKIIPKLTEQFSLKNALEVPRLNKIVLNIGVSSARDDIKNLETAVKELTMITGQKPIITRAKKSVSNFKIRKNMPIGCKVTLRGSKMYEFLDRFVNVALPRIRDFKGIPEKGFDRQGNYSLGIQDELIFPELNVDEVGKPKGLCITIETTGDASHSRELLKSFGIPFSMKKG